MPRPINPGLDSVRELYARYVSDFKPENSALSPDDLHHYYRWCDARYLPHLRHLPYSASLLEIGCGHGRTLSYLIEKGYTNSRGIDISEEQAGLARRLELNVECADVFEYLIRSSSRFDAVIAIDFLEHLTKPELLQLFHLLSERITPGGTILLQTPNAEGLFARQVMYGDLTHETLLSPGSLTQLLQARGFHDIRCYECAPIPNGILGIARATAWKTVRSAANLIRQIESHKTQSIWTENFICVAHS